MLRALAIALCIVVPSASSSGQDGWKGPYGSILDDPNVAAQSARALGHLYDMDLDAAAAVGDSLERAFPRHPVGPFLRGLHVWWRILPDLSTGDRRLDAAFFDAMGETIRRAERLVDDPEYALDARFFGAAAYGFRGRHRSNREQWLVAARDGKEALDLVFDLAETDPDNPDFQFGVGVYNYFASVIPEDYPIVRPVMRFFPDADREEGLMQLARTAREARYVGTEAAYFLLQIHFVYRPDYAQSLHYVGVLRQRHPTNAFFHVLEGRVNARWGRWRLARSTLSAVVDSFDAGAVGYSRGLAEQALYYLGRSHVGSGDLEQALRVFGRLNQLAERDAPASVYRPLGLLRSGMALDRMGRREEAKEAYRAVLRLEDVSDSHERARRYLRRPFGS